MRRKRVKIMDNAVALVRAYLNVNDYLTVAEYPVLEALRHGADGNSMGKLQL